MVRCGHGATAAPRTTVTRRDSPATVTCWDSPTTVTRRDSPATVTCWDSPTTVTRRDSPATVTCWDSPTIVTRWDSPTTATRQDSPTTVTRWDSPTTATRQDSPTTVTRWDSPTTATRRDSPTTVTRWDSPTTVTRWDSPTTVTRWDSPTTVPHWNLRRNAQFLLVFLLSLMSVRSSWGGVSLGAQLVCARAPGLTDKQRAMCRASPAAMAAIGDGLRMAYAECVTQMRGRRWNCSAVSDQRHFQHVIPMGTKEAAFTYALTSAGVTHALSEACARGDLPACSCTNRRRAAAAAPEEQWEWRGARCGPASLGARLARRFLDARELEHDARALMNLHNNRLGRKMVKELSRRECRCHGVSGSCGVRTCWRALPPFAAVGAALRARLPRARRVSAAPAALPGERARARPALVLARAGRPPRKADLVFLEPSPAYCEPQPAAAALGTHRRLCNLTSAGEDGCTHLCCGRGHTTHRVTSREQCHCRFQWCCRVTCDSCLVTQTHHVCN